MCVCVCVSAWALDTCQRSCSVLLYADCTCIGHKYLQTHTQSQAHCAFIPVSLDPDGHTLGGNALFPPAGDWESSLGVWLSQEPPPPTLPLGRHSQSYIYKWASCIMLICVQSLHMCRMGQTTLQQIRGYTKSSKCVSCTFRLWNIFFLSVWYRDFIS